MVELGIITDDPTKRTEYASEFKCPVCGQRMLYFGSVHKGEMKCPKCGSVFVFKTRYDFKVYPTEVDYLNGTNQRLQHAHYP
jgi:predicted RNA-binding Zn-ribbon protein involved in translation (DUF1610 family)